MIDLNKYSDQELLKFIQNDANIKDKAFATLYHKYSSRIYLYCRKVLGEGNYVNDIFQETFLKFLNAVEKGYEINNVLSYLLKTSRNLCLNFRRENKIYFTEIDDFNVPVSNNELES